MGKNCLAVGLSQGFIEPLEATALALSFETITLFMSYFENGFYSNKFEDVFNREINAKFEGVRDYIVCHYKANQRKDTDYWRDNAVNPKISEALNHILYLWRTSQNFAKDMGLNNLEGSYQAKSWACLLAGYGVLPPLELSATNSHCKPSQEMEQLIEFMRRCALNFRAHNSLLT